MRYNPIIAEKLLFSQDLIKLVRFSHMNTEYSYNTAVLVV